MANSQNGWTVRTSSSGLVPLRWITGRVLPGDVYTIFDHLGRRFNDSVEPINAAHSWGWAHRAIRGSTAVSNHASATAVDFNAPKHALGRRGTFSPAQVRALRQILNELEGVVRWGGDYSGRADEMHFEINASAQRVAQVAQKIRGGSPLPVSKPISTSPNLTAPAEIILPDAKIPLLTEEDDMFRIRVDTKTNGVRNASAGKVYLCRFGNKDEAVFMHISPAVNEALDRSGTAPLRTIDGRDYSEHEKNLMAAAIVKVRDDWKK